MIRAVKAREAVGKKLAQDYTCVTEDYKGAVKRRGEIVGEGDVELLEKCGHSIVYIYEDNPSIPGYIHEDEAVDLLAEYIAGSGLYIEHLEEAKAAIRASTRGMLVVNSNGLKQINKTGLFIVATRKTGTLLEAGELAGIVDLIPMYISESVFRELKDTLKQYLPVLELHPAKPTRVGIVVTGNEVFSGLVKDKASPVVVKKLREYYCEPGEIFYARDDEGEIAERILEALEKHDAVIVTGGMSVDPTDYTPSAIRRVADEVVAYGLPIKPTTMTMVAYRGDKPIIGVSACIIYFNEENSLDILLPWVVSRVKIPRDFLISLGEGGIMPSFLKKKHQH